MRGKRMLVVEEALKTESGHWYEYVKSVVELNRQVGAETVVASHVETQAAIQREINAHPVFAWTNWDNIYNDPRAWKRYLGIARHNLRVYRTMSRFVKAHGPFDVLFAPTVVIYHVIGWRLLIARYGGRGIGQMVLLFRNNAGSYGDGPAPIFKRSTTILKWALHSFAPLLRRGRVRFATDSKRLAFEYMCLSGIEPEVFPSARIAAPPEPSRRARERHAPLTFGSLGPARFEKGVDVMQSAIRLYLAEHPKSEVRFLIQWNELIVDADGTPYLPDPQLLADPRVALIENKMSSAEYDAVMDATDCMLLPYRRASYFSRGSGVALEAVTAGVPVIYTCDTWVADLVAEVGAGIGVLDNDSRGLADAIAQMTDHFDRFQAEATARAVAARESHSPAAFASKIWGAASLGSSPSAS